MKLTRIEAEIIIETAFPNITLKEAREALNNLDEAGVIQERPYCMKSPDNERSMFTPEEEQRIRDILSDRLTVG